VRAALWRKALADVRSRPLQSILLVLVVTVAAAGIVAGLGQQRSAAQRWDAAVARANGAHVAFFGATTVPWRRIARDPAVTQSAGPFPVAYGVVLLQGGRKVDLQLRGAGAVRPKVGRPLLYDGRWLGGGSTREIVLERSFALDRGLRAGDRVALQGLGGRADFTVVGVALDVLDCFYPECNTPTGWVVPAALDRVDPERRTRAAALLLRLRDRASSGTFESRILGRYGAGIPTVYDWENTRDDTLGANRFFGAFLAAFGAFLLFAAALVVASSVSTRVLAQYREIGILKAVGFTPRAIALAILGEHVALALAGVALGFVAGGLLAPALQLRVAEILEPAGPSFPLSTLAVALVAVLVIVVGATLLPAWRAGRVPTSRAITQGAAAARVGGASRLARLAARAGLRAPAVVGLKDAFARPLRAGLTIATLTVTIVAIVTTMGFERTIASFARDPAVLGDPQDLVIVPNQVPHAAIAARLAQTPAVASWFTATSRRAAVGDENFQLRALGGDVARSGYVIRAGRTLRGPGETIVGYGLLQRLHLRVGGPLRLRVGGRELTLRVVGWYAESEDTGLIAQVTLATLRRVEPDASPGEFYVRTRPGSDPKAVRAAIVRGPLAGMRVELAEDNLDDFNAFRAAFATITLLVLAVGLVNLVAVTALGVRERARDIGVLKTIGFTPRQVAASVAGGTGALALVAAVLGIPLGVLASRLMLNGVGRAAGVGPGTQVGPTAVGLLLVIPGAVAVGALVGVLAARRAAGAEVVEVLRAE